MLVSIEKWRISCQYRPKKQSIKAPANPQIFSDRQTILNLGTLLRKVTVGPSWTSELQSLVPPWLLPCKSCKCGSEARWTFSSRYQRVRTKISRKMECRHGIWLMLAFEKRWNQCHSRKTFEFSNLSRQKKKILQFTFIDTIRHLVQFLPQILGSCPNFPPLGGSCFILPYLTGSLDYFVLVGWILPYLYLVRWSMPNLALADRVTWLYCLSWLDH